MLPLVDDATQVQTWFGKLACIQVRPEFVDRYMGPLDSPPEAATIFTPSADTANDFKLHVFDGALVCAQETPEFVEININPSKAAATNFVPSADVATEKIKLPPGIELEIQLIPESVEVHMPPLYDAIKLLPSSDEPSASQDSDKEPSFGFVPSDQSVPELVDI